MKFERHSAIQVINRTGRLVVQNKSQRCTKCILPETFPDVEISDDGICFYCRTQEIVNVSEKDVLLEVQSMIASGKNLRDYDCIVLFSGGKDSSIALYTLKKEMNFNVLAFTLDNGFISRATFHNMQQICSVLGVDHLIYRPAHKLMKKVYSISLQEPFDQNTTKYSTSSCGSCISVVLASAAKIALEKRIPIMTGGWTPGQLTNYPILPGSFLADVCERHFIPLSGLSLILKHELEKYRTRQSTFPPLFNPLYCRTYNEHQIYEILNSLGWARPTDTDSCSTNCRLNGFLVLDHIYKYGYHPYEYELANHVRIGTLSRTEALARIENIEISIDDLNKISEEFDIHFRF